MYRQQQYYPYYWDPQCLLRTCPAFPKRLILPQIIMADQTLSGVPPVITLSGLQGTGGFSGQQQQTLSGQGGQGGGGLPGMTGGLDLMQLLAMLAGQQGTGAGTDLGLTSPLTAGSFGQPGMGGFGQGMGTGVGMAPMGGQSTVAGATGQQPGTSAGAGSIDPLAVLQKTLGLAQKGVGLFDTGTASPTLGDTGGTSMSDQVRSQQVAGNTGNTPSIPFTASPVTGDPNAPGVPPGMTDPNAPGGLQSLPGGGTGGQEPYNLSLLNQYSGGQVPPNLAALGVTQENLPQFLSAMGQAEGPQAAQIMGTGGLGTGLGEIPGVGITGGAASQGLGGATSGFSGTGDVNTLGAVSGGLGGLQGLLGAIQSLTGGGTDLSKVLGTIQGLGGAASGGAALSDALGATSGLGGAIGGFGAGAGALLSLAQLLGSNPKAAESTMGPSLALEGIAAPIAAGSASLAAGAAPAGSALAAVAPALSAIAAPLAFTGPVLGVVMAIMDALSKPGNRDINRLTGVQGPQTTQALETSAGLTPQGTDYSQIPTDVLERLIPAQGNALERYYNQNLPEDRYLTGLQATSSPELGQVQKALGTDRSSLLQSIAQLQQRGIGNDVIGNLMTPQLNNIAQMNNADWMGTPGYQSPAAMMQQYGGMGLQSNQQLAQAYGGPSWLALQNIFGPGLGQALGQYGGTAPTANFSPYQVDPAVLAQQAATQYSGAAPTADQIASQYDPNYAPSRMQIASQYGLLPGIYGATSGEGLGEGASSSPGGVGDSGGGGGAP
jgi:hypothetical protein